MTSSLKVTATLDTGVQEALTVETAVLVRVERVVLVLDEDDGVVPPEMAISAQVRYTWPVWKEFHRRESRVWFET